MAEFELSSPPTDGITGLDWADSNGVPHLIASSWDASVSLYDIQSNNLALRVGHNAPVLDCAFNAADFKAYSGGLDCQICEIDFASGGNIRAIGAHDDAVKCVDVSDHMGGMVITGSWDRTVRLWDPRQQEAHVAGASVPDKVFTMSNHEFRLVVGMANRHVYIYDMRRMDEPEQLRKSSLLHQTRCLRCYPNGEGYALSSIEGRVAMEYFDPSEEVQKKKKYAFKCHRVTNNNVETVYPINALAFHPGYGTFATGGCDGLVNVWDGANKKRLCQFHQYPTSIAAMSFSRDGGLLAIASSYTFEQGDKDHPADSIYIRTITDTEVKPKPKVQK